MAIIVKQCRMVEYAREAKYNSLWVAKSLSEVPLIPTAASSSTIVVSTSSEHQKRTINSDPLLRSGSRVPCCGRLGQQRSTEERSFPGRRAFIPRLPRPDTASTVSSGFVFLPEIGWVCWAGFDCDGCAVWDAFCCCSFIDQNYQTLNTVRGTFKTK